MISTPKSIYTFFVVFIMMHLVSRPAAAAALWEIQSVDTMKQSRDQARNLDSLAQVPAITDRVQEVGATHIAIGTPYDVEFLPFLQEWVKETRKKNLHIWFRGNFSGWEGWFDYPKLTDPQQHHDLIRAFILNNQDLFQDGDIFTPAPEPENGIIGDPRYSPENASKFLQFLLDSQKNCQESFKAIHKNVACGYFSLNGDIAKDIITPEVAHSIAPVVVDHYVKTATQFQQDIDQIHQKLQVPLVIGEIGAPIPDIHGYLSEEQQAETIAQMLAGLYARSSFIKGINYWVIQGGTTSLYDDQFHPKPVVGSLKKYYQAGKIQGIIRTSSGATLASVNIADSNGRIVTSTDAQGYYQIILPQGEWALKFSYPQANTITQEFTITPSEDSNFNAVMSLPKPPTLFDKILRWLIKFWK